MTKYKVLGLILGFQVFVTYVVNATGGSTDIVEEPTQFEVGGVTLVLDAIKDFLGTFWDIMTFQVPDLPYWISMLMYISSFVMFLLIVSLIRGTD